MSQRFTRPPHVDGFVTAGQALNRALATSSEAVLRGLLTDVRGFLADVQHPSDHEAAKLLARVDAALETSR